VNAKGTDIDQLVVGPGGVFTINAKHHRGARVFRRSSTRTPCCQSSRLHATAVPGWASTADLGHDATWTRDRRALQDPAVAYMQGYKLSDK
jgi:hypothetical protein